MVSRGFESLSGKFLMRGGPVALRAIDRLISPKVRSASGVCSPIIHKGCVYWAWRGVHCLDFATGKELWTGGKVGSPGSCILPGDDRIIVWADNGDLSLAEAAQRSPKQYRELAKRRRIFRRDAWPHVVLSCGRLFCKDRDGNLACFELRSFR